MSKFKQIIVVEGRDDTKRLHEAFGDVDTIETRGSAISEKTLALIKKAQATRGVIVLTDPDFPGEKIRKTISAAVPGVTHAFYRAKMPNQIMRINRLALNMPRLPHCAKH